MLDDLLPRLDGLEPEVILDPGGRVRSTWRTHRLCLESVPDDATHLFVVQDDALPCDGFAEAALRAIGEKPDRIICLFVPGAGSVLRQINIARKKHQRWFEFPSITFVPTVAVVYPSEIARRIPAYADSKKIPVGRVDDAVVSMFARSHRIRACAPLPSLVQHRDEVPSACGQPYGRGDPKRVAAWFEQTPSLTTGAVL